MYIYIYIVIISNLISVAVVATPIVAVRVRGLS